MNDKKPSRQNIGKLILKLLLMISILLLVIGVGYSLLWLGGRYGLVKTQEESTRGNLEKLRMVIGLYKNDRGSYPKSIEELIASKPDLLREIPEVALSPKEHFLTSRAVLYYHRATAEDRGTWGYVNDPSSPDFGKIFVNCTHPDLKGRVWSSY